MKDVKPLTPYEIAETMLTTSASGVVTRRVKLSHAGEENQGKERRTTFLCVTDVADSFSAKPSGATKDHAPEKEESTAVVEL